MADYPKHWDRFKRPLTPFKSLNVLYRAIKATAMHVDETPSNHDNDAPDTIRQQEQRYVADGVYRFAYRLYALPPEIRNMVFFASYENPIKLPGSTPNGIISLILALQNPQLRSKLLIGVWQTSSVLWDGSLHTEAWQRFKKTVMPHIRHLTIKFELTYKTWFDPDSEIHRTLAWMWRRGKPGNRARYFWSLEQLHLVGILYPGDSQWRLWRYDPPVRSRDWSKHFSLTRLEKDGVKVSVGYRHCRRPCGEPRQRPGDVGFYCLHSHKRPKTSKA